MLEMVLFGVILTTSMVLAGVICLFISFKLMTSPKFWKKYFKELSNMTNALEYMDLEEEA